MRISSKLPSFISAFIFLIVFGFSSTHAQTIEDLKAGVVKITATVGEQKEIGTGFIIKIDDNTAYIMTASHVVEGRSLKINFFPNTDKGYAGTTRNMQGGNAKGLAVIKVKGPLPEGLRSLALTANFDLKGGETVTIIGFRRSPPVQWGILQGTLTGQEGTDLIVSGSVANEGNSGGPILVNGKVVGVLTEVLDDMGYAVPSSITQIALKGWGVQLIPGIEEKSTELIQLEKNDLSGFWSAVGIQDHTKIEWNEALNGFLLTLYRETDGGLKQIAKGPVQITGENTIKSGVDVLLRD